MSLICSSNCLLLGTSSSQIGNSITRGTPIQGFKLHAKPSPVLYIDFELNSKQFEQRYTDKAGTYIFDENFHRGEYNQLSMLPIDQKNYDDHVISALTRGIKATGATVLIIDNITCLRKGTDTTGQALPLMKKLKYLKTRHGLSILVLAHTPKRNTAIPISRNDLQGSKMLMNFCDSAFAIGESHADKNVRYLKQVKQRFTECVYDTDNVMVCQTTKPGNFLQFEFMNYSTEWEHLKRITDNEQQELELKIKEVMDAQPGISASAIAKQLCKDERKLNSFRVKVCRIVKRLCNNL